MVDSYTVFLAQTAVRSLLYETAITPKPGLIDRANNGSHSDMDFFTFIDSSCAMFPYFYKISLLGAEYQGAVEDMLPCLREEGLRAEKVMYEATNGVNTHKGLIFSLGILCAAASWLHKHEGAYSENELLETSGRIASASVAELESPVGYGSVTNGWRIHRAYGLKGARGEAAAGFPNVKSHSYPVMKELMSQGYGINDAGVAALMHLMAFAEDTNIVSRSDHKTFLRMRSHARSLVEQEPSRVLIEEAGKLNQEFKASNLSPGGCADLLAITCFLLFLFPNSDSYT